VDKEVTVAIPVSMPTFGMTEGQATIVRWLKGVGERVVADEVLFEAENEKATLEVPAPGEGVLLAILVEAGEEVALLETVAWIGQPGEEVPDGPRQDRGATAPTVAGPAREGAPAAGDESWVRATPIARRLARQHGLDLHTITGTGPGGRVKQTDVEAALAWAREAGPAVAAGPPAERQPLTTVRRLTAERMAESFRTAPHFYLQVEVRAGRLVDLRESLLAPVEVGTGIRFSYTDLLLLAVARVLPGHPLLNATWEEDGVCTFQEVNLCVAMAGPQGLVVPVIRQAHTLSLEQLVRERHRLAEAASQGQLLPADMQDGTFTLTNLGMFGIDQFIPILNPPQSAILAAGAIAERPVGRDGRLVLEPTLHLTLSCDHRVVDGAEAAVFLQELRRLLEAPAHLLLPARAGI
jgi:pyruvate dehydrogenase E2 component (dihydrolipoamide acetyltransferase)